MSNAARLTLALLFAATGASAADQPGQKFNVTFGSLPKPYATPGVANESVAVGRPAGALPEVPPGFKVEVYASGFANPRWMAVGPNGDVFLAEPQPGRIDLLHSVNGKVT